MSALSTQDFVRFLRAKKGTLGAAELVIGNLIGYRKTSLHRAEDHDTMSRALEAAMIIGREEGKGRS
jgi:hypothetical protein